MQGTLAKTTKEAKDAQASLAALDAILVADKKPLLLDSAVTSTMLDVFNLRATHGVTIATAGPAKVGGSGGMAQLTMLAEDVPSTSLKSVKVNVAGSYNTYQGLMAYLVALQAGPVAVTRLKVQEQSFDLSFRIYGSLE